MRYTVPSKCSIGDHGYISDSRCVQPGQTGQPGESIIEPSPDVRALVTQGLITWSTTSAEKWLTIAAALTPLSAVPLRRLNFRHRLSVASELGVPSLRYESAVTSAFCAKTEKRQNRTNLSTCYTEVIL